MDTVRVFEVRTIGILVAQSYIESLVGDEEAPEIEGEILAGYAVFREFEPALKLFRWLLSHSPRPFTISAQPMTGLMAVSGGDVLAREARAAFLEREEHDADEAERRLDAKRGRADT